MIEVQARHHPGNVKSGIHCEPLDAAQNLLGPFQLSVIRNHYHSIAVVADRLHTSLCEHIDALPIVVLTPGWIGVESVVFTNLRKSIKAIVQHGIETRY